ncbi:hypothetical protein CHARACLAT_026118, partial [Characodon lateralis]|nr:hypothetical protein [Characodon lateralis]
MLCSLKCSLLFSLHFVFILAAGHDEQSGRLLSLSKEQGYFSQSGSGPAIVHPVRISADGEFVSHSLSHHFKGRVRRELRLLSPEGQVYYKLSYNGRTVIFNLTRNNHLLSTEYILEKRNGSSNRTEHGLSEGNSCHLLGTVEAPGVKGTAAISTCNGL